MTNTTKEDGYNFSSLDQQLLDVLGKTDLAIVQARHRKYIRHFLARANKAAQPNIISQTNQIFAKNLESHESQLHQAHEQTSLNGKESPLAAQHLTDSSSSESSTSSQAPVTGSSDLSQDTSQASRSSTSVQTASSPQQASRLDAQAEENLSTTSASTSSTQASTTTQTSSGQTSSQVSIGSQSLTSQQTSASAASAPSSASTSAQASQTTAQATALAPEQTGIASDYQDKDEQESIYDKLSDSELEEAILNETAQDTAYLQDLAYKKELQKRLPKSWVIVWIFGLLAMLIPICIDMYLGSFPVIAKDFHTELPRIEFSLSIFFIGIAGGQFLWGPLSDSIGRRNITLFAIGGLAVSCICVANTYSLPWLYTFRFTQGFCCAALLVTTVAILRDIYDTRDFARVNGLVTIIFFVAPFLAPLFGSWIVKYSSWHYIFYAIALMCILCFVLFVMIPETINPMFKRKLEFKNTVVGMAKILTDGRSFWLVMMMSFSSCMIFTYVSMASGIYQTYYGVTPSNFPFYFMINIIGQSTFNLINTKLVKRLGPAVLLIAGVVWMLISSIFNISASLAGVGFWGILLGILLAMSCSPVIFLNSISLFLEIHYKQSGTATSLVNVARWVMPGLATAITQLIDPHQGHTMTFVMGVFSFLVALSYLMYRYCAKKAAERGVISHI